MEKYSFQLLNAPSTVDQGYGVTATSLNNNGDIVGSGTLPIGTDYYVYPDCTILWKSGLDALASPVSDVVVHSHEGININDNDEILCIGVANGTAGVFRNGQFQFINTLPGNLWLPYVTAKAMNGNGIVTGYTSNPEPGGLFIYDSRAANPKINFLGFDGIGYAINSLNTVAALPWHPRYDPNSNLPKLAFLIKNADTSPLKIDLGEVISITDINDAGEVVGRRIGGFPEPSAYVCKTSSGTADFIDLGILPGYESSQATAINNHGDIVGNCYSNNRPWTTPFLKLASGEMQDLNSLVVDNNQCYLNSAADINDEGWITGRCKNGNSEAGYLLKPIPEIAFEYQRLLGKLYSLAHGTSAVWFGPGTRPIPTDPRRLWEQLSTEQQDILIGISIGTLELFSRVRSREELERKVISQIQKAIENLH